MGGTKEVWIAATALATVLAAQQDAAAQAKSGVVQVKIADVQSQQAGGKLTPIRIGDSVFANQKIQTGRNGRAKIILLDRSSLLIGPNSEVTIESFEFDQKESVGAMSIEAAKGLFRFVGGLVSKRRPVQVRTSVGTIGIRGAVVVISKNDDGSIDMYFMYGDEATFDPDSGGEGAHLNKPGFKMTIDPSGGTSVSEASIEELDRVLRNLEGEPGSTPPVLADTQVINRASPDVLELFESEPGRVQDLLEDLNNESGADFDRIQEALERLGVGPGGTG